MQQWQLKEKSPCVLLSGRERSIPVDEMSCQLKQNKLKGKVFICRHNAVLWGINIDVTPDLLATCLKPMYCH